jgi:hypothetical protein
VRVLGREHATRPSPIGLPGSTRAARVLEPVLANFKIIAEEQNDKKIEDLQ